MSLPSSLNPRIWLASLINAWNYSRIIFLNAAAAGFAILWTALPYILEYAIGVDWTVFFDPKIGGGIALAVNLVSIFLRLNTFSPPGATAIDKEAIRETLEETPSDIVAPAKDLDVGNNKAKV